MGILRINIVLISIGLIIIMIACKRTEKIVDKNYNGLPISNPYDEISYDDSLINSISLDPYSIVGLHKNIFQTKCAQPACHDGAFDPDFRTVQSTYNTLVFQQVTKQLEPWDYRVVPVDTAMSWLWQRINHEVIVSSGDTSQGRMPLYSPKLEQNELNSVAKWIMDGAPDVFGQIPHLPDLQPSFFGIYAEANGIRVDTARVNNILFYPFEVSQGLNLEIWFGLYDTDANGDFLGAADFSYNKVKLATRPSYMPNAIEQSLNVSTIPNWKPSLYGGNLPYYHSISLNTSSYNVGDIIYMQVIVNDNDNVENVTIPGLGAQTYLQTYFSFVVI